MSVGSAPAQGATGSGLGGEELTLPLLCAAFKGYSLHAGVLIGARDREGLRRLAGTITRPPLALDRVEALPGDRVRSSLKRPWSDGTTALEESTDPVDLRLEAGEVDHLRLHRRVLLGRALPLPLTLVFVDVAVRPRPPTGRRAPNGWTPPHPLLDGRAIWDSESLPRREGPVRAVMGMGDTTPTGQAPIRTARGCVPLALPTQLAFN